MESSSNQVVIECDGFELRTVDLEDAQLYLDFWVRNKEHLRTTGPLYLEPDYFTLSFWEKRFEYHNANVNSSRFFIYKDGMIIGDIAATNITRGISNDANLGYKIDKDYEGKGIMTKAGGEAIKYFFDEVGLHRLQASHLVENRASARVLKNLVLQKLV